MALHDAFDRLHVAQHGTALIARMQAVLAENFADEADARAGPRQAQP